MNVQTHPRLVVPADLLDALRALPQEREVDHCGRRFTVSSLDLYAQCPSCGTQIKVRGYTGGVEVEDIFDAVFEWMTQPGAIERAKRRIEAIQSDLES